MARAKTKTELVTMSTDNYESLITFLEGLSEEQLNTPFNLENITGKEAHWKRDKNIRDVIAHLHEWHNLLIEWIEANQNGTPQQFLKPGYNWKTYGQMNLEFVLNHQDTDVYEILEAFKSSHHILMSKLNTLSDHELFTKGVFEWTKGSTLGSYFISTMPSHYDWAIKKLKKCVK